MNFDQEKYFLTNVVQLINNLEEYKDYLDSNPDMVTMEFCTNIIDDVVEMIKDKLLVEWV